LGGNPILTGALPMQFYTSNVYGNLKINTGKVIEITLILITTLLFMVIFLITAVLQIELLLFVILKEISRTVVNGRMK